MSFANEGLDLDPKEVNCCAWTKWVGMNGFGIKLPKEICGMPSEETKGKDTGIECCNGG